MICGVAFAALATAAPAFAQDEGTVDAVVVTGSRIARPDYVSASPIVSVGQEALQKTGSVTVDTLLNQLPQFVPSVSSTSNNPSNGGQANIELRGLGTQRTLVLLDGHRVVPSNSDGTVDINILPTALIENIEVISGGASATYGSDAIAGVVNFRLNNHFTGLVLDAQYGITDKSDGQETSFSITGGSKFADDRGHAVISLSYANRNEIFNADRGFASVSGPSGTTPYGAYDASGINVASQAAVDTIFAKYGVPAGTVKFGDRLGFNPDGTLYANPGGGAAVHYTGSDAIDFSTIKVDGTYNTGPLNLLQLPLTRYSAYGAFDYDINDHVQAYASFNYTHYDSRTILAPTPASGGTGFSVPVTNPFIPADLKAILASRTDPNAPFSMRKRFSDVGGRVSDTTFNVSQFVVGARGDVGFKDWTFDIYGSIGRSEQNEIQNGNISRSGVQSLLTAADGGASICTGGYNPFGLNALSESCRAIISRTTKNYTTVDQHVVEANVQGGLFNLPAGEVRFAVGADYKEDRFSFVPDALLSTGDVIGFNASNSLRGSTDVYELYGELSVPILKDLPLIKALNVDLGYRFSDYSTVGDVSAYKANVDWEVFDGFRVRGGYQRAVRAPNIFELYSSPSQNFPSITKDPCAIDSDFRTKGTPAQLAGVRALCIAQGLPVAIADTFTDSSTQVQSSEYGNTNLKQETADTWNIGLVWTPHFDSPLLERFSASIDYYDIKIEDAIGKIDPNLAFNKCYGSDGNPNYSPTNFYCTLFNRLPGTGAIDEMQRQTLNLAEYKTSGIDFQVDWGFGLGAVGLDDKFGALRFNLVGTWLNTFEIQPLAGEPFNDIAGTIGDTSVSSTGVAHPEWKLLTSVGYTLGPVDVGVRWRRVGEMVDAANRTEKIGAVDYFDLNGTWRVNDTYEIRLGVNNVGDKEPPQFTSSVQANTDPSTYDVLGRRYYVGIKARF